MTVEEINDYAIANYEKGGDIVIETMTDAEKLEAFKSLDDLKFFCEIKHEQRLEIESTIW